MEVARPQTQKAIASLKDEHSGQSRKIISQNRLFTKSAETEHKDHP